MDRALSEATGSLGFGWKQGNDVKELIPNQGDCGQAGTVMASDPAPELRVVQTALFLPVLSSWLKCLCGQ